jgi:hypothetical protein
VFIICFLLSNATFRVVLGKHLLGGTSSRARGQVVLVWRAKEPRFFLARSTADAT